MSSSHQIKAFANADQPGKFKIETRQVGKLNDSDILIDIKASGVCHTDCIYLARKGKVLGHEAVGEVIEIGPKVKGIKKGDYVGYSYLKSSCLNCDLCVSAKDVFCPERVLFPGDDNNNGFADSVVVDSRFAYHIPPEIEPSAAGPLMCAGVTVFNTLYANNVSPTHSVGIVGIGGLGHLALQFASKWGCHVTAISSNTSKEKEAKSFGANEFLDSKKLGESGFMETAPKFDYIINTTSADLPYDDYLKMLKPQGKFLIVGVPSKPIEVKNIAGVIQNMWAIEGVLTGGRTVYREMLKFAARHKIKPQLEEYPFTIEGLEAAIAQCEAGKARYRIVLVKK
ncbi:chaperonin 10-like protein [Chlamydoabsidia padenii]|nr:chaperonin 10-like protein [Chlamydoabsidia padenii]